MRATERIYRLNIVTAKTETISVGTLRDCYRIAMEKRGGKATVTEIGEQGEQTKFRGTAGQAATFLVQMDSAKAGWN